MLYREIIAVCSQIHTKHTNTLCGQNVEFLNVPTVFSYSYRMSSNDRNVWSVWLYAVTGFCYFESVGVSLPFQDSLSLTSPFIISSLSAERLEIPFSRSCSRTAFPLILGTRQCSRHFDTVFPHTSICYVTPLNNKDSRSVTPIPWFMSDLRGLEVWGRPRTYSDLALAQAVSRRPLTAETLVRS